MQCREIEELLSEYIDGVLDQQEQNRVAEHLQECTACSRSLSDLQDTVRLLRSLGEVAPPVNFRKELREKLAKEILRDTSVNKPKNPLRGLVSGYKRYAAVAAALVGLGVGIYGFNQPEMDKYFGSSKKAAQQEIALDTASSPSIEATRSSDSAAGQDSFRAAEPGTVLKDAGEKLAESGQIDEETPAPKVGAGDIQNPVVTYSTNMSKAGADSVAEDSSAPLEFTNDPASAPPGMGEGVSPAKSRQVTGTSEAPVGTAPEPEKAFGLLAAETGTADAQPSGSPSSASGEAQVAARANPDAPVSDSADQVDPVESDKSTAYSITGQQAEDNNTGQGVTGVRSLASETAPETPPASGQTEAKAIRETSTGQLGTEGKTKELSGQKTEVAGEPSPNADKKTEITPTSGSAESAEKESAAADKASLPLVVLAVLAAGAAVVAIIYYLRRRV